jgi:hypothetical protein
MEPLCSANAIHRLMSMRLAERSILAGNSPMRRFGASGLDSGGQRCGASRLESIRCRPRLVCNPPDRSGETLFDVEPGAIAVPVLVVSNQNDTCAVSPPGDAPSVLATLTRLPRKELAMVTSSQIARRSDPCEGMSPRGYLGIEGVVVLRISDGSEPREGADLENEVWNRRSTSLS